MSSMALILSMIGALCMQGSNRQIHHYLLPLVPEKVGDWSMVVPDGVYGADTLYEYINGGAEVYKWMGVRVVLARKYAAKGRPDIIVDIFDMGRSVNAFGAYHHDSREGPGAGMGAESEIGEASLAFWKGPYFVSIIALDSGAEVTKAIKSLGEHIAGAITTESPPPALLSALPRTALAARRFHFFHGHESLNAHYYLAFANVLGLSDRTNGFLAKVPATTETAGPEFVLVLIEYPDQIDAARGEAAALKDLLSAGDGKTGGALASGGRGEVLRLGRRLALFLDVPAGVDLGAVKKEMTEKIDKLEQSR